MDRRMLNSGWWINPIGFKLTYTVLKLQVHWCIYSWLPLWLISLSIQLWISIGKIEFPSFAYSRRLIKCFHLNLHFCSKIFTSFTIGPIQVIIKVKCLYPCILKPYCANSGSYELDCRLHFDMSLPHLCFTLKRSVEAKRLFVLNNGDTKNQVALEKQNKTQQILAPKSCCLLNRCINCFFQITLWFCDLQVVISDYNKMKPTDM